MHVGVHVHTGHAQQLQPGRGQILAEVGQVAGVGGAGVLSAEAGEPLADAPVLVRPAGGARCAVLVAVVVVDDALKCRAHRGPLLLVA